MPDYISREQLAQLIKDAKKQKRLTDELALVVYRICDGMYGRFKFRLDLDDWKQEVALVMMRSLKRIDIKKNCFSYISTVAYHEAVRMLRGEGQEFRKCCRLADWLRDQGGGDG